MKHQQRCFDRFRHEYNQERPHESLEMRCPAELYEPSPRAYPKKTPEVVYPGHYEVRLVHRNGDLKLRGHRLYLSYI